MTHLSLFTGIGGLDLAAEWAGFTTVGQCEFADYPTKVLEKHWPDVPRWRDIRTLTRESFYEKTGLQTVDIISGGFPCQPFSVAGKQKGKEDDRYLWPEMLRVIRELTPRWVIGENVPGILRIAGRTVCEDLEREGYDITVFNFEAAAVGAPHRRARCFFVANAKSEQDWRVQQPELQPDIKTGSKCGDIPDANGERCGEERGFCSRKAERPARTREVMADATDNGRQGRNDNYTAEQSEESRKGYTSSADFKGNDVCNTSSEGLPDRTIEQMGRSEPEQEFERPNWWAAEPDVGRLANGVPARVDRLKCIGNAVVPQQAYPIFKAIMEVER